MQFKIGSVEPSKENFLFLTPNKRWNDFSFITTFLVSFVCDQGVFRLGEVKIGFKGQDTEVNTHDVLSEVFERLPDEFFSLGQELEYYEKMNELGWELKKEILSGLRDVAFDEELFQQVNKEVVFSDSLARYVSNSSIKQFRDVIKKGEDSKHYGFKVNLSSDMQPDFLVSSNSKPPSNVHAIIGRNGVGKSYLLRDIVINIDNDNGYVTKLDDTPVTSDDFGLLLYFSMSVFEKPFKENIFNQILFSTTQTKKKYIGIYEQDTHELKNLEVGLAEEFSSSLYNCLFSSEAKKETWGLSVEILAADVNFINLRLNELESYLAKERNILDEADFKSRFKINAKDYFITLSSGHSAILYYLVNLIELTENKTICIFDEPENYLHPPLLSAFIRVMSFIMSRNNSMAVIATHSPVLLQEIPKDCVWKIQKLDDESTYFRRPSIETFGESVSDITSDVFGLDLRNTGFFKMIESDAKKLKDPQAVLDLYNNKLGLEGRAVAFSYLNKE